MDLIKLAGLGGELLSDFILCHDKIGILDKIMPEIAVLKDFKHGKEFHPESEHVFGHVMCALKASKSKDYRVILSILFHDIGKALTYKWNEEKHRHTYHGHDFVGSGMILSIGKRYGFAQELIDIISFCCAQHMRYHELDKMQNFKRDLILNHKYYDILKEVCYADASARRLVFKEHSEIYNEEPDNEDIIS